MTDKGIRLRPPDYVVLGMVRLGARSGYDIKKAVRELDPVLLDDFRGANLS